MKTWEKIAIIVAIIVVGIIFFPESELLFGLVSVVVGLLIK